MENPTVVHQEPLTVAGSNKGHCQVIAQWLSDIGGIDAVTRDLETPPPGSVIVVAADVHDVELANHWTADRRAARVMVGMLTEPSWPLLLGLMALPVSAVVVLPVSGDLLLQVLAEAQRPRAAHQPVVLLSSEMLHHLPADGDSGAAIPCPPLVVHLTPREYQILALLDRDYGNERIAEALVISPHTVKRHLEHLFAKLGVGSRHEAVRLAHRCGLIRTRRGDPTVLGPVVGRGLATS